MRRLSLILAMLIMLIFMSLFILITDKADDLTDRNIPHSPAIDNQHTTIESRWDRFSSWLNEIVDAAVTSKDKDDAQIIELALSITDGLTDDFDKMVAIYDWVTGNIAYDLDKADNLSAFDSGAIYVLEQGSGVCHDYAELTKSLLTAVGIESTYEMGNVHPTNDTSELHAWNQALINGKWYALDTTWGAGFLLEGRTGFVQRPSRLYLTSPEELDRLHSDPAYKREQELLYLRGKIAAQPVLFMPDLEHSLISYFNQYRFDQASSPLTWEPRLTEPLRLSAVSYAENISSGDDYFPAESEDYWRKIITTVGARSAKLSHWVNLLYYPEIDRDFYNQAVSSQAKHLDEAHWKSIGVGAVQKGELIIVIIMYYQ